MFSNAEIKARFFADRGPVDRHGNPVNMPGDFYTNMAQFPLLAHYHILKGMSDAQVLAQLRAADLSVFEANYILADCHAFIKDILEIDLTEFHANRYDTATLCGQLVVKIIRTANEKFAKLPYENIVVDGITYQACTRSREAMAGYISTGVEPEFWTTADNICVPHSVAQLGAVQRAIVERDNAIHVKTAEFKSKARIASELREYDTLVKLEAELDAM